MDRDELLRLIRTDAEVRAAVADVMAHDVRFGRVGHEMRRGVVRYDQPPANRVPPAQRGAA